MTVKEQKGDAVHARLDDARAGQRRRPRRRASAPSRSRRRTPGSSTPTGRATPPPAAFPILCAIARRSATTASRARTTTSSGAARAGARRAAAEGHELDEHGRRRRTTSRARPTISASRRSPCRRSRRRSSRRRCGREITQAGALGDPYGSGVRTVWWVYGVGPVKIVFQHAGGERADHDVGARRARTRRRKPPPPDDALLPARQGREADVPLDEHEAHEEAVGAGVRRRTRSRTAPRASRVKHVSGPIRVAGRVRLHAACRRRHELLGDDASPRRSPASRRSGRRAAEGRSGATSSTPFDLMLYGFNPIIPAYPTPGATWSVEGAEPRLLGLRRHRHDEGPRHADGQGRRRARTTRSSSSRR